MCKGVKSKRARERESERAKENEQRQPCLLYGAHSLKPGCASETATGCYNFWRMLSCACKKSKKEVSGARKGTGMGMGMWE